MIKTSLLTTALLLGLAAPAFAQVNVVPQTGLITGTLKNPTYTATSVGLVPAASATDIWCISPGTTRMVAVRRITIGGTAGTAITTPVLIYRRVTLDSGGTAATSLALPVAASTSTIDQASTATVTAYTANPTVNDSSPTLLGSMLVDLPVTTAAGGAVESSRTWGTGADLFTKALDLQRGTTQQICLNLNGVSVSSGVLSINVEWSEIN